MKAFLQSLFTGPDWTTWLLHGSLAGLFCVLVIKFPFIAPFLPALYYLFREWESVLWLGWKPKKLDHVLDVLVPLAVVSLLAYWLV